MDIHEYQAKEILANFGVGVPPGALAYSPEQAAYRARELGGDTWVVKAQVHAGGRGKAGGVKVCRSDTEIVETCENLFGSKLVTHQLKIYRRKNLIALCAQPLSQQLAYKIFNVGKSLSN